jgi:hypothetical protein
VNRTRVGLTLGLCTSLLAHGVVYTALRWAGTLPDVGIEITFPAELEFGVAEGAALPSGALGVDAPTDAPSAPTAAPEPSSKPDEVSAPEPLPKPKPKPKKPKPKAADAGVDDTLTHPTDGGTPSGAEGSRDPQLAAYAPPGAQLALRLDMDRVRSSPLAPDAARLLAAIPDVGMILDGSGVDPIHDLSRLFIASPNLKRASFVLAGRYVGGDDVPQRAAEQLASAQGKTVKWSRRGGIRVAPWENRDETPRVLALLAPSLFAITRPDDLPRIVSVARALAKRDARKPNDTEDPDAANALLAMEDHEVVAFSVENAKSFARGNAEQVPERLSISVLLDEAQAIRVVSIGVYEDDSSAAAAHAFWEKARAQFARHPLVALVGMSAPLRDMTIAVDGPRLVARTTLSLEQAQKILAFATDMLTPRPARPADAPPVRDAPEQ